MVDELKVQLHPTQTKRLVGLFNISTNRRTLSLFLPHTIKDCSIPRESAPKRIPCDQIWFAEKTPRGASELFSLSQIPGIRKGANLEKEYLPGQFGSVSNIGCFQKVVLNGKE